MLFFLVFCSLPCSADLTFHLAPQGLRWTPLLVWTNLGPLVLARDVHRHFGCHGLKWQKGHFSLLFRKSRDVSKNEDTSTALVLTTVQETRREGGREGRESIGTRQSLISRPDIWLLIQWIYLFDREAVQKQEYNIHFIFKRAPQRAPIEKEKGQGLEPPLMSMCARARSGLWFKVPFKL